jgi:hypothetical protein
VAERKLTAESTEKSKGSFLAFSVANGFFRRRPKRRFFVRRISPFPLPFAPIHRPATSKNTNGIDNHFRARRQKAGDCLYNGSQRRSKKLNTVSGRPLTAPEAPLVSRPVSPLVSPRMRPMK